MDTKKNSNEQSGFKKEISLFGATSLMFNIIIGAGIFYLGSLVLLYAGFSEGMSLLAWILGGVVSLLGAFCFAELGTQIKKSGGHPTYLSAAYHPVAGYVYTFTQIFISSPASTATFALAFITAFQSAFGLSEIAVKISAIALIFVVGLINMNGVKTGTNLAKVTTVLKLIPIFMILIGGCIFGGVKPDLSLVVNKATGGTTIGMLLLAVNATLWAYSGWQLIPAVSEEMKNPTRDIPRVLIMSISAITLIYTLFNFAIYRILPKEQIVSIISGGNLYTGTSAANTLFSFGGILVTICIMISVFGSFNSSMLTAARTQYTIAEGGHFFKFYGQLSSRGVPYGPIIGQVVLGSLFVIFNTLQGLTVLAVFISCLADMFCIIAVPVMRKKYPDLERPYKVPVFKLIVPLAILFYVAIAANTIISQLKAVKLAFIAPVLALIVYYLFSLRNKKQQEKDNLN